VGVDGSVSGSNASSYSYAVRPTFSLLSSVTYTSGTGTSSDPIRIS